MISYWQAIIIGLLQGVSELFPISSLGHSVILPRLLGWNIHQNDSFFISFLVATHLATALVLVGFFWKDWKRIVSAMWRSLAQREIKADDHSAKLGWLLVVGTIPAGILGLLLEDPLKAVFASARSAAFFLILNGLVLFGAEMLRRKVKKGKAIAALTWTQAFIVGGIQAFALIPGFSRSGVTIAGSLLVGLSHEDAARYAFLLATPIIAAAALLKVPDLFTAQNHGILGPALVGAIFAGISAYFAVKFLMKYFESTTNKLTPFAVYCVVMGLALSTYFLFRS